MARPAGRFEIAGHREHHLANVVPLHRAPQPASPPSMFDQDDPDLITAAECVLLTRVEAKALRAVLCHARQYCPASSQAPLHEAIELVDLAAGRSGSAGS